MSRFQTFWKEPVQAVGDLPLDAKEGDAHFVLDTDECYVRHSNAWCRLESHMDTDNWPGENKLDKVVDIIKVEDSSGNDGYYEVTGIIDDNALTVVPENRLDKVIRVMEESDEDNTPTSTTSTE